MEQLKKEIKNSILLSKDVIHVDVRENERFIDIIVVDYYHDIARYNFSKRAGMITYVSGDVIDVYSIEKMNDVIYNYIIRKNQNENLSNDS